MSVRKDPYGENLNKRHTDKHTHGGTHGQVGTYMDKHTNGGTHERGGHTRTNIHKGEGHTHGGGGHTHEGGGTHGQIYKRGYTRAGGTDTEGHTYGGTYTRTRTNIQTGVYMSGGDTHRGTHTRRDIHTDTEKHTNGVTHERRRHTRRDTYTDEHTYGGGETSTRKDTQGGTYTLGKGTHTDKHTNGGIHERGGHTRRDTYTEGHTHGHGQTYKWEYTHVKRQITEEKKSQIGIWHGQKTREREASRRGFYIPCINPQIHPLLGKAKKSCASRFYQLKTGHGAIIGTFLERIGAAESAECWWCGDREQSVLHLYTNCRKWRRERRVLKRNLDKLGIQWQRRPEKKWLAELLANEKAVGPLLVYLKDTNVGSREGAVEKSVEWRRRRDQEGEEQLSSLLVKRKKKEQVSPIKAPPPAPSLFLFLHPPNQ